jgi:Bacteriophage head to tail connecting protein
MAICDAMITPYNMLWSVVKSSDTSLMRQRRVQEYYRDLTMCLWNHRYRADSLFFGMNQVNWHALGVFGNMGMLVEELETHKGHYQPGLSYQATSPGEMYILKNYQQRTNGYIRHFRWSARKIYQRWPDKCPPVIKAALDKSDLLTLWDIIQFVVPNTEYDPMAIFNPVKRFPWVSVYVSVQGYCIMEKGGYRSFPWARGGYGCAPEEEYDRGPCQECLPELKTLNSVRGMFLRQGHKAAEPAYLINDDGLNDLKVAPNSFNYGGMNSDGRPLVGLLPTGEIQITKEMIQESRGMVNDSFLVSLFPSLSRDDADKQKTARQFVEELNERGIFLAPTLGRQYGDYIGPMIDRELDILNWLRLTPKLPPELKEAKGQHAYVYCSPLAKAMHGQAIAGYMRTVEMAKDVVQITGDPSLMDHFDWDVALPEIADAQFVPVHWMAPPQKIAAKAKQRAAQQKAENDVKSLPGRAAIMKAQAVSDKAQAGQNIGGVLSGTPQGGMPLMPGQNSPGGRAFGQPGPQGP